MTLRPEIQAAAEWVQSQLDQNKFSECGCRFVQHDGEIRRTEHSFTIKQSTDRGDRHARRV